MKLGFAIIVLLGMPIVSQASTKICVNPNVEHADSDGSCWDKPYNDLQTALEHLKRNPDIHEIWLAQGEYYPSKTYTIPNQQGLDVTGGAIAALTTEKGITAKGKYLTFKDNKENFLISLKTFHLPDKIRLIGGFKGDEKHPDERSRELKDYPSVLDGEDKVWHVITLGNDITRHGVSVYLERLTITGGDAREAPYYPTNYPLKSKQKPLFYHDDGAGIYGVASNLEMKHVKMIDNKAVAGGAIYMDHQSTLKSDSCYFSRNWAHDGGAIHMRGGQKSSTLDVQSSTFIGNYANHGSAIYTDNLYRPSPLEDESVLVNLENNYFRGGQGGSKQPNYGTVYMSHSQGNISNSKFSHNRGTQGAAIAVINMSTARIKSTKFKRNIAQVSGGAIWCLRDSIISLDQNYFLANKAISKHGGAIFAENCLIKDLTDNRFVANTARHKGKDIYNLVPIENKENNQYSGSRKNTSPEDEMKW